MLQKEEFTHCRNFYSKVRGRDEGPPTRGNKYRIRGEKIMRNSELLITDRITAEQFLERIIYKENNMDFGLMDVETVNVIIDETDESQIVQEQAQSQIVQHSKRFCVVREVIEAQMCVLP